MREASELSISPSPDYHASPASDSDLFEWHFTLRGPPSSPFASGIYHGRIVLPPTYPLRPPSFRFLTPSGRFETNREICLSISGHHEETWQPAWGIRTALVALRSFMETDAKGQLGGLDTNEAERKRYAERSVSWRCPTCGKSNEDIMKECTEAAKAKEAENGESASKAEETVPPELKIGFKPDSAESSPERPLQAAPTSEVAIQMETATYPAARPVQGLPQPTASSASRSSESSRAMVTARPENIPAPTPTTSSPIAQPRPQNNTPAPTHTTTTTTLQTTRLRRAPVSNDEDLVWIDRAIAGIVICLVFMVTKVFLGL